MLLNKEIIDKLVQEFGVAHASLFCTMEARKYQLLQEECIRIRNVDVCDAFDYEASWWKQQAEQLNPEIV